ncbi:universal stress protein [Natronorarus salvus]|uniref:universal stress protein n=1 Tax=Natronorarus salvus TaxID=3117733 RepID=UPI002F26CBAC
MASNVLVAVDGSEQSFDALEYAASEFGDATITALTVLDPAEVGAGTEVAMAVNADEWMATAEKRAESHFEKARGIADETGVDLVTETEIGRPARTIVEVAEEGGFDHVVMGSHGREGVSRILLGSVAESVVRRSPVPVTVVR